MQLSHSGCSCTSLYMMHNACSRTLQTALPAPCAAPLDSTSTCQPPHLTASMSCAGKYMLAHAASAQGISAVENICNRPHVLNHASVPAACFTHPEVSNEPEVFCASAYESSQHIVSVGAHANTAATVPDPNMFLGACKYKPAVQKATSRKHLGCSKARSQCACVCICLDLPSGAAARQPKWSV